MKVMYIVYAIASSILQSIRNGLLLSESWISATALLMLHSSGLHAFLLEVYLIQRPSLGSAIGDSLSSPGIIVVLLNLKEKTEGNAMHNLAIVSTAGAQVASC